MRAGQAIVLIDAMAVGAGSGLKDIAVKMDASAPRYGTRECEAARHEAIEFADSAPDKTAVFIALGLIPLVGAPASLAYDMSENKKAKSIYDNLKSSCGAE